MTVLYCILFVMKTDRYGLVRWLLHFLLFLAGLHANLEHFALVNPHCDMKMNLCWVIGLSVVLAIQNIL